MNRDIEGLSPDALAQATAQAMYDADACSRALGMEIGRAHV